MPINWNTLGPGISSLADMIEEGRARREEEEQIRRVLQQQSQVADALKASGTVPPTFGALLQSFQPPPPASAAPSGLLGGISQAFGDIGRGRRRGAPAGLFTEQEQEQTLNEIFRVMLEQQKETKRSAEQQKRLDAAAARQQAGFEATAERQQAGLAAMGERQDKSLGALLQRMQESQTGMESRQVEREAATSTRQQTAETAKEAAADRKTAQKTATELLDTLKRGKGTQATVDNYNNIRQEYKLPESLFPPYEWGDAPGWWGTKKAAVPKTSTPLSKVKQAVQEKPVSEWSDEELRNTQ